jgi:hypothetical protein
LIEDGGQMVSPGKIINGDAVEEEAKREEVKSTCVV